MSDDFWGGSFVNKRGSDISCVFLIEVVFIMICFGCSAQVRWFLVALRTLTVWMLPPQLDAAAK